MSDGPFVLYPSATLNQKCVGRDCQGRAEYVATFVIRATDESDRRVVTICLCKECVNDFLKSHPREFGDG